MMQDLEIHEARGVELLPWLEGLGRLRIRVFREYPYLYDGTEEYEREYLKTYVDSPDSLAVIITNDKGEVVGATTCLPLRDEAPEFQAPFLERGMKVGEICYFAESLLLPELRGRGLGKEFFLRRESHAQRLDLKWAAFCAVDRPDDHPLRPKGYRPLDPFWRSQGFEKHPELRAAFPWKEIGEAEESPKTLTFWMKACRH